MAEAAARSSVRFVAVKSAEKQARAVALRTHPCFVRLRTQLILSLRGHLADVGIVAAKGPTSPKLLRSVLAKPDVDLPDPLRETGALYLEQIGQFTEFIEQLAHNLESATKTDEDLRRLCTVPGIRPVTAGAIAAFAPDLETCESGRNFAAWLGLVPRQRSTGGKTRFGAVSKMGQCDIRWLQIVGAMSVIRWVVRKSPAGPWTHDRMQPCQHAGKSAYKMAGIHTRPGFTGE